MRTRECRRLLPLIVAAGLLVATAGLFAARPSIRFDTSPLGVPPAGFLFAASRQAAAGTWEVRGDAAQRYLAHLADPTVTMRGISVAAIANSGAADVKISTRLRLLDGDRAGGVVWRYQDANNFYFMSIVLADKVANVIRVSGGNRIQLARLENVEIDPDSWHTITVQHHRDQIRGSINGLEVLRARDNTIADAGRLGVWSAGNSTTWFDNVTVDDAPE